MPFAKEFIDVLMATPYKYDKSMIIDYNILEDRNLTKIYAEFIKKNIKSPLHKIKAEPFELFLVTHPEPNAWAWLRNGKFVICIHVILFKIIERRIKEKLAALTSKSKEILAKYPFEKGPTADFLIYQFATTFTFYHELAHLFQQAKGRKGGANFEKYNLVAGAKFEQLAHAMEIDADIFAAEHMNAHVFQFWSALPEDQRTKYALELMLSLCLLSCFILFFELSSGWKEWYTLDYDHPNSLIRVCYIHDVLNQTAKANEPKIDFEIDSSKVLQDTLALADHFLSDTDKNGLISFIKQFHEHADEIDLYIKKEMFPYMDTIPYLNNNEKSELRPNDGHNG